MPIVQIIEGDILNITDLLIAQQCNCISKGGKGFYLSVIKKYPDQDPYKTRDGPSLPGTIQVDKNIIHLFAQWAPGSSKLSCDTKDQRIFWFKQCLDLVDQLNLNKIAVPYGIGCGLAGGHWPTYEKMLMEMKTEVVIYRY